MKNTVSLKWSDWEGQYKPSDYNPITNTNKRTYSSSGEQLNFVKSQDPKYVWSWVLGDVCDTLVNGFTDKNVSHYYICKKPWDESNNYEVVISVKVDCVCYDEDAYENGNGYENCKECEGTGYHREWIEN